MIIEYAYISSRGKQRRDNEDNLWCAGSYLPEVHDSSPLMTGSILSEESPVFCIFDGIGGEQHGETASFLCAQSFDRCTETLDRTDMHFFLEYCCRRMNQAVSEYAKEQRVSAMGSTAAMLGFSPDRIYACNVGDSRIYRLHGPSLQQLSTDHTLFLPFARTHVLIQSIGLDPEEALLEPSIADCPYDRNDIYLICSDGLTDMVPESRICQTLSEPPSLHDKTAALLSFAMDNGGRDNITIILCQIRQCA